MTGTDRSGAGVRIAVATADTVAKSMAGPAIRAWHIAEALAADHDVRLVAKGAGEVDHPAFEVAPGTESALKDAMDWCDVFIFQGWILAGRPHLVDNDKILVADVYDPMHLEQLEQGHEAGDDAGRVRAVSDAVAVLNEQLLRGDFFLCASGKQRDFWLGQLAALGRINPATYDEDESLGRLLAVVPFGIPDEPAVRTGPGIRGVIPGIGPDDPLILWGGGIYNWFDPLTLIRAVDRLRARIPNLRLVFLGLRHPNPEIPQMRMAVAAQKLSDDRGLTGRHVFFNESWVPYQQRQNHLLDADIGVSIHLHHIETEFSFRTRILDYFWAGLPVVATGGDALGRLIDEHCLGLTVPPDDELALELALFTLLTDRAAATRCRRNIEALAPELTWSRALEPLVEFCRQPRRAPDLVDPALMDAIGIRVGIPPRTTLRGDLQLFRMYLAEGGVRLVVRRVWSRFRRAVGLEQL